MSSCNVIRSDLADTIVNDSKLENWFIELDNFAADETLIDLYLQKGNYSSAMSLLDSLPALHNFTAYDLVEYPYYSILKTMQADWLSWDRNVFELTVGEISQLEAIATSSTGTAGAQARGILTFSNTESYEYVDCVQIPDTTAKSKPVADLDNIEDKLYVTAKPNPASGYVRFEYSNSDIDLSGTIHIWNTSGQLVQSIVLTKSDGAKLVNVESWNEGMYFYSLAIGHNTVSGKLLIKR